MNIGGINGNQLVVFYVFHPYLPKVYIRGILDFDFFEEPEQIQYINPGTKERQLTIPENPYDEQSVEYQAYNSLVRHFKADEEFVELLSECASIPETFVCDDYKVEMERLKW